MDNVTISITDPGWPWDITLWAIIIPAFIFLIGVAFYILGATRRSTRWGRNWKSTGQVFFAVGGFTAFICLMFGLIGASDVYDQRVHDLKVQALEDAGLSDVYLSDADHITGDSDGAYFKGALVELEDSTWQVVELKG